MSEVKNNNTATEKETEEKKFQIKVVEKADFDSSLNIEPMKLSDLAASLNGLFSAYKDFIGSEFRVDTVNGVNSISYSLCFLLGHNASDGIASAFVPVDAQIKANTRLERQIEREKASLDGKKSRLTKEGVEGLEPYILGFIRRKNPNNWYKTCVSEICERDRFGNISNVYVRVSGIDYKQCIKEIWGNEIKTRDGLHDAVYDIRLKRP